ncbi:MAG: hypothetical protein DRP88_01095 [Candidatus Neomarinimicrobiota bacterium]|nr:MAG: hypothetical protein DRP88_01095 [Candidatus Neomarinimicrobiota bacterium]
MNESNFEKMGRYNMKRYVLCLTVLFLAVVILKAGNTGKIAGVVTDKKTGKPLVGVNVIVRGTTLGAATDEKGRYYIIQVPIGTYEVEASYIGYAKMVVKQVKVMPDLTTQVNFELTPSGVRMREIVVMAENRIVQKDITSTRVTSTRAEMEKIPGFEKTTDFFTVQGAAIVDMKPQALRLSDGTQLQVRDESLKNIHIRGGRGGEILFMVDGMPVTHPIYGGRDVLDLNINDIEGIELITGAFNAEYGQAQSGVVNITTRSGSNKFEGGIEYKTSELDFLKSYPFQYLSLYAGGPEPITTNLLPVINLKIPGKVNYFVSTNWIFDETPYSNGRNRDFIETLKPLKIKEKQDNSINFNSKLTWKLNPSLRMIFSYHGSWKSWTSFDWLWKNYPDHMAEYSRSTQNFIFNFNHTISKSTFYNLNLGYLEVKYRGSFDGMRPPDFWIFVKDSVQYNYYEYISKFGNEAPDAVYSTVEAAATDPYGFIDSRSYQTIWRDDFTRTFTLKGDFTSQVHPEHLVKTGFEVRYNDIHYVDIQDGGVKLSDYGNYVFNKDKEFPPPIGPYKEFGQNRWVFDAYPVIGACYIQDKFEKESLIINAGVRADWFMPGPTVFDKDWKKQWEDATGLESDWPWIRYKISPRFGISFPISVSTVLFFSYGHFNQLPELQYYYRDPYTGGFTGNPHLDFEQTILYEFGFTHEISRYWGIDIKSYTKDISNQVGTTRLKAALGLPVDLYDNKGYARAKGIEVKLIKNYSNFYSGRLTYTIQWANGYSSSAFDDYIRSINDFPNPIRERRLSWDIRHQILLQLTISSPEGRPIEMAGIKLPDNWDLTILSKFSSGQPYTPGSFDPVELQKKENTETGPPIYNTDIKFRKMFRTGGLTWSVVVDIYNVFDTKNVQIAYGFNNWTGKPYKYGDINPEGFDRYYDWWTMYRLLDPRRFSYGRYVKIGLSINIR